MIQSKQTYVARLVWLYVTKYPHSLAREIAGAQTQYSAAEIGLALGNLERQGYIKRESTEHGMRGYVALVPFVVSVPAWAVG